jgi:hypothetical protein
VCRGHLRGGKCGQKLEVEKVRGKEEGSFKVDPFRKEAT